jgi:autotransporter-associated beta strand protein
MGAGYPAKGRLLYQEEGPAIFRKALLSICVVAILASAQPVWAQFAASFTMTSSAPNPAHVFPMTPITVTLWDTQGYGTTLYADDAIRRIQLNWTNSSAGLGLTTGSTWAWGDAFAGILSGMNLNDTDMAEGIVTLISVGEQGVAPGPLFIAGTLTFAAPAYNPGGGNTHALSLAGGSYDDETLTFVAGGSPALVPGDPDGVQLLAPPHGTGLTLATHDIAVVAGGFWTGGTNSQWQTGTNWTSQMTPGSTFEAVFDAPTANQPALTKDEAVKSVEFRTAGWNVGGPTHTLTVGSAGISSAGSGTNTVNPTVNFTGNTAVSVGPDNTLVLAAITGASGALAKSGTGTLVLSGDSSYSGGTTVSEGTLLVTNIAGSGTGTGAVTVDAATLGGTGFINGPVTLTGDSTLTSTGTLTINNTLTIQGLANQLSSGTVLTSGDVTIEPGAVFIINGTLGGDTGSLIVFGTLMGKGTINKGCIIEAGGVLSPGSPSMILSMPQVRVAATPRNFSFEIGAAGPNYATPSNSLNDLVRLTNDMTPFADATGIAPAHLTADTVIDVYFVYSDPAEGTYKAQFFASTDFSDAIADATFQYWRLDPHGNRLYNGNFYSSLDASLVDWSVVPETAMFGGTPASGYITQFAVVPEPASAAILVAGFALAFLRRRRGEAFARGSPANLRARHASPLRSRSARN